MNCPIKETFLYSPQCEVFCPAYELLNVYANLEMLNEIESEINIDPNSSTLEQLRELTRRAFEGKSETQRRMEEVYDQIQSLCLRNQKTNK